MMYLTVLVKGNMLGTSMFYGSGAGKLPQAARWWLISLRRLRILKERAHGLDQGKTGHRIHGPGTVQVLCQGAGSYRNKEQDVKSAFGQVEVIELYGMDEFASSPRWREGEFRKWLVPATPGNRSGLNTVSSR